MYVKQNIDFFFLNLKKKRAFLCHIIEHNTSGSRKGEMKKQMPNDVDIKRIQAT